MLNNGFNMFLVFFFSLLIYSYVGDTPLAQNLRVEYALPINKEFNVSVGKSDKLVIPFKRLQAKNLLFRTKQEFVRVVMG